MNNVSSLIIQSKENKYFCEGKKNANLIPAFHSREGKKEGRVISQKMSVDFKKSKVIQQQNTFFKRLIDNLGKSSNLCDKTQRLCDVASSLRGAVAAVVSDPLPHHSFKWLLSTPMALTLCWLHIYPEPLHLQYLAPVPNSPSLDFFQQCFSWSY